MKKYSKKHSKKEEEGGLIGMRQDTATARASPKQSCPSLSRLLPHESHPFICSSFLPVALQIPPYFKRNCFGSPCPALNRSGHKQPPLSGKRNSLTLWLQSLTLPRWRADAYPPLSVFSPGQVDGGTPSKEPPPTPYRRGFAESRIAVSTDKIAVPVSRSPACAMSCVPSAPPRAQALPFQTATDLSPL